MAETPPRRKTLVAALSGVALAAAGFFGFHAAGDPGTAETADTSTSPSPGADAGSDADPAAGPVSGLPACSVAELPPQALDTAADIRAGGPYEFPANDDTRFGNYEQLLPDEELGYYREYTVVTPGVNHRGERRIVTGGGADTRPEVWYYTADHYESFCEIYDADQK